MLHEIGKKDCAACCCGTLLCECGGFIHSEHAKRIRYGDNEWGWLHNYTCDKCNAEDLQVPEERLKFNEKV